MSQFYANVQGNKGGVTRCGNKSSGLTSHTRGWNLGARVEMTYNGLTGKDECRIILTSGSSDKRHSRCLGTFTEEDLQSCNGGQGEMFK